MKETKNEKNEQFVTITATRVDEYGKFQLITNLPIFNDSVKKALQDELIRSLILKVSVYATIDQQLGENGEEIVFDWKVEDVTETEIFMNLIFAEPLLLSNQPDIDYHSVTVQVLETVYFTSLYND